MIPALPNSILNFGLLVGRELNFGPGLFCGRQLRKQVVARISIIIFGLAPPNVVGQESLERSLMSLYTHANIN